MGYFLLHRARLSGNDIRKYNGKGISCSHLLVETICMIARSRGTWLNNGHGGWRNWLHEGRRLVEISVSIFYDEGFAHPTMSRHWRLALNHEATQQTHRPDITDSDSDRAANQLLITIALDLDMTGTGGVELEIFQEGRSRTRTSLA